jgi:hypothetical protein
LKLRKLPSNDRSDFDALILIKTARVLESFFETAGMAAFGRNREVVSINVKINISSRRGHDREILRQLGFLKVQVTDAQDWALGPYMYGIYRQTARPGIDRVRINRMSLTFLQLPSELARITCILANKILD